MKPRAFIPILFVGVLSLSLGAILARLAQEANPLVIAFWRCAIATGAVAVIALPNASRELRALTRGARWNAIAAGVCLALHFHTWIASLGLTTVAASCILVATVPIWTALLTPWLSRDSLSGPMIGAIALAFLGVTIIGWGDFSLEGPALRGDLLAVVGAIFAALYVLAGRSVRPHLSLPTYLLVTYGTAALWLGAATWLAGESVVGYESATWWALVGLALVPQLIGHSILNWSLRWFSANFAAVAALGEPICATTLAWLLFEELPDRLTAIGAPILILGVVLAIRSESEQGPSLGAKQG